VTGHGRRLGHRAVEIGRVELERNHTCLARFDAPVPSTRGRAAAAGTDIRYLQQGATRVSKYKVVPNQLARADLAKIVNRGGKFDSGAGASRRAGDRFRHRRRSRVFGLSTVWGQGYKREGHEP